MKHIHRIFLFVFIIFSCSHADNHTFRNGSIEGLHAGMTMDEVKTALVQDSLSAPRKVSGVVEQQVVPVWDKDTHQKKLLLIFEPEKDSLGLYAIEILSPAYVSEKGAGLETPYSEWKKKHKITRAERTLRHVVVFVDDLNAILEFNNEDLVETAQYKTGTPDPDWIKAEAKPTRIVLFMKK